MLHSHLQPDSLRLFVAVQVPHSIKTELERVQGELRRSTPGNSCRWTNPAQMHLTLRFLGSVATAQVEGLTAALRQACLGFAPLQLGAQGIGFFPNMRAPRVIWAGVSDWAGQLAAIQQAVADALREFTTEPADNKFTGHLTLARIKSIRRPDAEALGRAAGAYSTRSFGAWTASAVDLIQSQLSSGGATHSVLAQIGLG